MGIFERPHHQERDQPGNEKKDHTETNGRDESGSGKRQDESPAIDVLSGMERFAGFHARGVARANLRPSFETRYAVSHPCAEKKAQGWGTENLRHPAPDFHGGFLEGGFAALVVADADGFRDGADEDF